MTYGCNNCITIEITCAQRTLCGRIGCAALLTTSEACISPADLWDKLIALNHLTLFLFPAKPSTCAALYFLQKILFFSLSLFSLFFSFMFLSLPDTGGTWAGERVKWEVIAKPLCLQMEFNMRRLISATHSGPPLKRQSLEGMPRTPNLARALWLPL